MGLLFTTAEPEQLRVLGLWLGELAGGKAGEQDSPYLSLQIGGAIEPADDAEHDLRMIVSELVALLNGKRVLNDSEGMALLRKLSK